MYRNHFKKITVMMAAVFTLASCSPGSSSNTATDSNSEATNNASASTPILESYSAKPANFRFSLTDAPSKDLKSVFVNVHSAEVWLKKGDKEARVQLGKDLGLIDLMTLRNGVLLPVEDFNIPEGVEVTQIRLILGSGNYAVKGDDSTCSLQTPSAQQSGIKIKLSNSVTVVGGHSYSLVVDFDAAKSVVLKGNGDCLLKPVLKIASFTKIDLDVIDDEGNTDQTGEDVTGGVSDSNTDGSSGSTDGSSSGSTDGSSGSTDGSTGGSTDGSTGGSTDDSSGYDSGSDTTYPPIIDPDTVVSYLQ